MIRSDATARRDLHAVHAEFDLVIVGGGLAGTCCAITAARQGVKVALVQDRPVLGGNSSSEVRLWVLGATSHMGNNNRWAREGGVIDEILVENTFRNPEGNALVFDTVLLEKVLEEPNITLLLNTAVYEVEKSDDETIAAVKGFCSQNSTEYELRAPLFVDASGDGIVGFLAGAAFRMGAETRDEFGEAFAPTAEYGELLGHSIYFYSRDAGRPVKFTAPTFALKDVTTIPRWRAFNAREIGCQLWWIEYGGRRDTVHDTEDIKWELWKVVYGVWDHIKNSGQFPEAENLTLEWVGTIPGKRESRRFEGDYMLTQQDVVEQRTHDDAVSFGGWAIDLHPADGVYSDMPGCNQWHSKGVYPIPFRCMYSRNVTNLLLAGRTISASHVAFGSTRVMATCAHNAQAVAVAAALCKELGCRPRDLLATQRMQRLQRDLTRMGQYIPHVGVADDTDAVRAARVTASSVLSLEQLPPCGDVVRLDGARAMLLPLQAGPVPEISFWAHAESDEKLVVQLRTCSRDASFTPDEVLDAQVVVVESAEGRAVAHSARATAAAALATSGDAAKSQATAGAASASVATAGLRRVRVQFNAAIETARYAMVCFLPNPAVSLALSDTRVTGVLALRHTVDYKVSKSAVQRPPAGIGVDSFEFWLPERRPGGRNLAMAFDPPLRGFGPENVASGPERPTDAANAWVADVSDERPVLEMRWDAPRTLHRLTLCFDTDFDHPMESVLMGHPERRMPFCVGDVRVTDGAGRLLAELADNHQTRRTLELSGVTTDALRIELRRPAGNIPASLFRVRVS